jgi:hypothetical protein
MEPKVGAKRDERDNSATREVWNGGEAVIPLVRKSKKKWRK